jgi:hypothetical protein
MANTLKFGSGQWATKVGSTLAYNDENGNFKPLPFNFTRSTSATRVNKDGLIEVVTNNKPRIDFLNDSNGALKLEPSRSNLLTYSEEFNNAAWNKYRLDLETNTQVSPSGVQNADTFTSSDGQVSVPAIATTNITFSGNTRYSCSIYAKKIGTTDLFVLGYVDNSTGYTGGKASYNLTTQSITITQSPNASVTASMESVGNGWYRLVLNFLTIATPTFNYVEMNIPLTNTTNTFAIWGAQLEQGSYATSYIPTQGAIGTRVAESCIGAGNNQVINSTEGVLFAEISALANDGTQRSLSLNDGTTNNRVQILFNDGASNVIRLLIKQTSYSEVSLLYSSGIITDYNKIAIRWGTVDVALWVNGVEVATVGIGGVFAPNVLTKLNFNAYSKFDAPFFGKVKSVKVYNATLTDQELQALTKI